MIHLTYRAFEPRAVVLTLNLGQPIPAEKHSALLETLFAQTNLYQGDWWEILEPEMKRTQEVRCHTALSVGDFVTIDGTTYKCASVGWEIAEDEGYTSHAVALAARGAAVCIDWLTMPERMEVLGR